MPSMRLVYLLVFLSLPIKDRATNYIYNYNDNCSKAYNEYLVLHMKNARAILTQEKKSDPGNLMITYIADYEDCILLLLNCDKAEYDRRVGNMEVHLQILDRGDKSSPWFRFCKAGVYLRWALIQLRFGEQYKAAMNFHRSFALLKENQQLFPGFDYNNTFSGLEEAVVGSLPGSYKWVASIFGMRGNVKQGTDKLASFISKHTKHDLMYTETVLYYLYTRFYLLQDQKEVWAYLNSDQFSTADNLLNAYVKTNLALDYRQSDAAIATLQVAFKDADHSLYPVFYYQMGVALLSRADTASVSYFDQFLKLNKSDLYIKDCWQKMAFAWYIADNMQRAEYCRQQVKTQGTARIDADKQADKFAESGRWPLKKLLQARLLIDGGYYSEALKTLNSIETASLKNRSDKSEYFFRYGRVYEESESYERALEHYRYAIMAGNTGHEQFAARAALQMGKIYERQGKSALALSSYRECLDMPEHDFQNSIDQQAKAGINRIEER